MDNKNGVLDRLYNLRKSFVYAATGIAFCIKYEKNMRIHIVMTAYVLFFSQFYDLSRAEFIILILVCALVMALEMINTAIEVVVDKISPNYNTLAKISKDVAAGGVFVASIAAAVIGLTLFIDIEKIKLIFEFFTSQLSNAALLIASLILSIVFIESGKKRKTRGQALKK